MPDEVFSQDVALDSTGPLNVVLTSIGDKAVIGSPTVTVSIQYAEGSEDNAFLCRARGAVPPAD